MFCFVVQVLGDKALDSSACICSRTHDPGGSRGPSEAPAISTCHPVVRPDGLGPVVCKPC
eukprot:9493797-Pyramimonas_sp.AAC.1